MCKIQGSVRTADCFDYHMVVQLKIQRLVHMDIVDWRQLRYCKMVVALKRTTQRIGVALIMHITYVRKKIFAIEII